MLYREFVLRSPAAWQALAQLVAANAKAFIDRGRPLRVIVTEDEKKRTTQANAFYQILLRETSAFRSGRKGAQPVGCCSASALPCNLTRPPVMV